MRPRSEPLRAITYLVPGIPLEFFEAVVEQVARAVGRPITLESEPRISGPMHGDHDPFAEGQADIGFLCSPSYLYLRSKAVPSVELVRAGFVFDDPRNGGRPHYFSEVVVRAEREAESLCDLRGAVLGFNDSCSLSGYYAAQQELARRGAPEGFFAEERCTGSHAGSIEAILDGTIDVATIDSNTLSIVKRRRPEVAGALRVVESLGPHPIQPTVVRRELGPQIRSRIESALLGLSTRTSSAGRRAASLGLGGCVPIDDSLYAEECRALEDLGQLAQRCG